MESPKQPDSKERVALISVQGPLKSRDSQALLIYAAYFQELATQQNNFIHNQ